VEENNIKGDKESEEDHFLNCPNHSKDELDSLLQRSRNNIIKKI
jgi:hypothetical protein